MNRVCLIGRLTEKPELKISGNGKSYCKFTLAVDRYNGEEKTADFINCVTWNKLAENLSTFMKKGSRIAVIGNIKTSKYEDKNRNKRYLTEVYCDSIEYLETKKNIKTESEETTNEVNEKSNEDPFAEFGRQIEIDDNYLE